MALPTRDDSLSADWVLFREHTTAGNAGQALEAVAQRIEESSDPLQVAQALIELAAAYFGARNWDALPQLVSKIEDQLRVAPHLRLLGQYHTVAGAIAYERRSYGMAVLHLVEAERALERMDERTRAAVDAWHDLAGIYSKLGYHARALEAARRCQSLCADSGLPPAVGVAVWAYVQAAVVLDQRGDTAGCVRELMDLVERSRGFIADLAAIHRVPLRYAVRRLAALDHPIAVAVPAAVDLSPGLRRIDTLGQVCDALAAGRPEQALAVLDEATDPLDSFGVAEPLRLRSLALAQLGDHAGALAVERSIFVRANEEERELRRLLAAAAGSRIDQDQLRRSAERHARAAVTDPLTGLPNRRKVDKFTHDLTRAGTAGICGILDLDGFKAINDSYGHATGDSVLQRVAGILTREVRPTDLVARLGGDEFVVVMPDTTRSEAETVGEQIEAALRDEDWHSVVPGIPVGLSIGWADIGRDVDAAFRAADAALYATKRIRRI